MIQARRIALLLAPLTLWVLGGSALAQDTAPSLTARYSEVAGRILGAALVDTEGWKKLEHLTTRIGPRLSGSEGLTRAIDWALATMQAEGLEARTQAAMVPHWVRGAESLRIVRPRPRSIAMLGLGGSVATPEGGITAPVVVVRNFDELESLGREGVKGKIVVYAVEWEGYGKTVRYRAAGPSRAARLGAVAALVRSATGRALYTPHTGALSYTDDDPRIPAAAITVEDAMWMLRVQEGGGETVVHLEMEARTLEDAPSANVIAEIRGTAHPDQVVVMGGHFDSWDVGQGAHDDGASCIAAWEALTLLHRLGLRPKRTLRVVLWTNEENGGAGGRAYRASLGEDASSHVAAIEMDGGCERPLGFGFTLPGAARDDPRTRSATELLRQIASFFDPIDADLIRDGGHGADISPLMADGVPGLALVTVGEHYFDWHHTDADTLDKVEPKHFRRAVAMLAVMGFVLADMEETLGGR
ncbi:MAG TPA: peptidase M28 family protein [Planctomycetes bacterium]|nr:peptidase M28 family protein [Planctomycetota bacterium]